MVEDDLGEWAVTVDSNLSRHGGSIAKRQRRSVQLGGEFEDEAGPASFARFAMDRAVVPVGDLADQCEAEADPAVGAGPDPRLEARAVGAITRLSQPWKALFRKLSGVSPSPMSTPVAAMTAAMFVEMRLQLLALFGCEDLEDVDEVVGQLSNDLIRFGQVALAKRLESAPVNGLGRDGVGDEHEGECQADERQRP